MGNFSDQFMVHSLGAPPWIKWSHCWSFLAPWKSQIFRPSPDETNLNLSPYLIPIFHAWLSRDFCVSTSRIVAYIPVLWDDHPKIMRKTSLLSTDSPWLLFTCLVVHPTDRFCGLVHPSYKWTTCQPHKNPIEITKVNWAPQKRSVRWTATISVHIFP